MEELTHKLQSGNPIFISQIISKLVQIVKNKQKGDNIDTAEFKFLKEKCVSNENGVNVVAAEAILNIVRNSDASLAKSVLTDFVTIITTRKCSSNVIFLMNNLLLINLENELSVNSCYKSSFNLRMPQHPFIIILNEDSSFWSIILREITYSYKIADKNLISHYNELYKPVFLYTLCNPQGNVHISFKQKLWTFIIKSEALNNNSDLIYSLLSWMQFENRDAIEVNSEFLIELVDLNTQNFFDRNLLLLWQISTLHQLIINNYDPRAMIFSIFSSLRQINDVIILNPILLILSKSISSCTSVHLLQLLKLCNVIICEAKFDNITGNIIKSSLLQWIANPSSLTADAVTYASKLFSSIENSSKDNIRLKGYLHFSTKFQELIDTHSDVYLSLQIYIVLENWKNNKDIIQWIDKVEKAPIFFTVKIFDFLIGLFLTNFEETTINLKVFELILKCIDYNKMLATKTLPVILYKLTSTTDTKLHYQLLKAIPKMAVITDNLQKVVGTIQALNKGRNTLKIFSATLMLDLWKINNKCYSYLENFLIASHNSSNDKWEFFVTKAHILKELCALKPELYGTEMVAHLSKILNECNNADGALASALAIEGITLLCKSEIIDAVSTWATLAPMFKTETRIPVIKSLCDLILEIPSLSYTEAYPKLIEDVVAKLWEYLLLNPDDEVWEASLNALTHFSLEQIVAQTPDEYFDEETLNIRKSGHVVPGHCWILFLKNCSASKLKIAGNFLIKLVSLEVSAYLKFVYQVKGTREPVDYSYLPVNSVVRGISTYIKSKVLKWKGGTYKEIYLQCLRIFSQEYSKPLPPLDWCFLQELFHEPEAKEFCINIAAHQVVLSGTARRFMVNYIEALTENHTDEKEVLFIYSNLKYIANSVQPFTLKPFLEGTIYNAVELFKNKNEEHLRNILSHLKITLQNQQIQEANKFVIAEIIIGIFNEIDISSKLFELLLECATFFPMKSIDDISSPKSIKEIRSEWFKKAIRIRCYLALHSPNPALNLLNDLIDNGSSFPALTPFLLQQFAQVFEKHKDNTECVLWVLELIGQIQAVTAEKSEEKDILFLCNIFILATIVFSGHFVLLGKLSDCEEMYKLFPRAIGTLLDVNHWSICTTQALEWFHHMYSEQILSKEYKDMFIKCLQSLRHDTEFRKNMKWTKFLNVEC